MTGNQLKQKELEKHAKNKPEMAVYQILRRRIPGAQLNHGSDLRISTEWHDVGAPGLQHTIEARTTNLRKVKSPCEYKSVKVA